MGITNIDLPEMLRSDIGRLFRLHRKEELPTHIVSYIEENFVPKVPIKKGDAIMVDKEVIIELVCSYFKLSPEEIINRDRHRDVTYPRHVLQYLLFTRTSMSCVKIGLFFDADHTTILSARNKIRKQMEKKESVRADLEHLISRLPKEEVKNEPEIE